MATAGKQVPAVYNQFFDSAYLAGGQDATTASPNPAVVAPAIVTTMTVTPSYGSIVVSAATTGSLYLDGKPLGELPAGAEARLDNNVEVGDRLVELRYPGGGEESKSVRVEKGGAVNVTFVWKPSAAKKPTAAPAVLKTTLSIGDSYAGGIVFYLDGKGDGLVAAPTDQGDATWADAKVLCGKLALSGFHDWRLPSKEELDRMYKNLKKQGRGGIGSALLYWSSTEYDGYNTWGQFFDDGRQYVGLKGGIVGVRSVRSFNN